MIRHRVLLLSTATFFVGVLAGGMALQYLVLLNDFPRAMNLRAAIAEVSPSGSPAALRLLDAYESEIHRQMGFFGRDTFDWQRELLELELRRYNIYRRQGKSEFANQALSRAADFQKRSGRPVTSNLEFLRRLAEAIDAQQAAP